MTSVELSVGASELRVAEAAKELSERCDGGLARLREQAERERRDFEDHVQGWMSIKIGSWLSELNLIAKLYLVLATNGLSFCVVPVGGRQAQPRRVSFEDSGRVPQLEATGRGRSSRGPQVKFAWHLTNTQLPPYDLQYILRR